MKQAKWVLWAVLVFVHVYAWGAILALAWWQLFNAGQPPYNVDQFLSVHASVIACTALVLVPLSMDLL